MSIWTDPETQAMAVWTIEFLTMLATWFAALGTISATVVALWLGYRTGKTRLTVEPTFDGDLCILVTNPCERPVTLTKVTWRVSRENRPWLLSPVQVRLPDGLPDRFPKRLELGDPAFLYLFLVAQGLPPWLKTFPTDLGISAVITT